MERKLGWEGAEYSTGGAADGPRGAAGERQGLAVCLCFEGGSGTIGTIKVCVRDGARACARALARGLPLQPSGDGLGMHTKDEGRDLDGGTVEWRQQEAGY
jgi:hypothetical protein